MHHRIGLSEPRRAVGRSPQERGPVRRAVSLAAAVSLLGFAFAPSAHADTAAAVRAAVIASRGGGACPALRSDTLIDQIAEIINRSTDGYLNQSATRVPIVDAQEGLKELGYNGTKAYLLQGADANEALAIKAALLEGYDALADCAYADFGASVKRNDATGFTLVVIVLAGP